MLTDLGAEIGRSLADRRSPGRLRYRDGMDPFASALADRPVVLDGGLATRLEARGHDLSDTLWSARLLSTIRPEIRAAHEDTSSPPAPRLPPRRPIRSANRASQPRGIPPPTPAKRCGGASGWPVRRPRRSGGLRWVAASVGPYGATADGLEYRGDYGLSVADLRAWHRPRLEILAEAGADLLAVETIPCWPKPRRWPPNSRCWACPLGSA